MDDEEAIPVTHLIYMVVEALVKAVLPEVICLEYFFDLVVPNMWSAEALAAFRIGSRGGSMYRGLSEASCSP